MPWSNTMEQLENKNFTNTSFAIEEMDRYSIIYEGNASIFDQILVSKELVNRLSSIQVIHLNTTEPDNKQISDHDPVLVDFQF